MPTLSEALENAELRAHCQAIAAVGREELGREMRALLAELDSLSEPGSGQLGESIMRRERLLDLPHWGALFDALHRLPSDELAGTLRKWGRERLLCGPECSDVHPPLARAISERDLIRIITGECGVPVEVARRVVGFLQEDEGGRWRHARRVLDRAANPSSYLPYKPLLIGKHLMWGTYARNGENGPFDGMTDEEIEASLGLASRVGQRVLVMWYVLNEQLIARFPTVAEAAASEPWNGKFRPAPEGAPCGFTEPNDGFEYLQKQPEVVHSVVEIDALRRSLRLLDTWLGL